MILNLRSICISFLHLLLVLKVSMSSVVIDTQKQRGIYMSEYCPSMKYCPEGSHVLCMYYNPNEAFGPHCYEPRNMTITPELAEYILNILNAIRSKTANGKITGKDYTPLPRGYGIFRLKWDNELATFAQILANQCMLKQDLCRATKKFEDPGQIAGVFKLTYPDWQAVNKLPTGRHVLKAQGLNSEKLEYSVSQVMMSWYSQKTFITQDMIENVPNYAMNPNIKGRLFLEVVRGASTRVGCGMTAYTELNYYQRKPSDSKPGGVIFNMVLLVCNFSTRNKKGDQAFFTTRPPYSSQCGCPEGTQEDSDCLCIEGNPLIEKSKSSQSIGIQVEPETCSNPMDHCESNVVLLPIFTIENAPPEKLLEDSRKRLGSFNSFIDNRYVNRSNGIQKTNSLDLFDILEDADNKNQNVRLPDFSHSLNSASLPSVQELVNLPMQAVRSVPLSLPHTMKQKLDSTNGSPNVVNDSGPIRVRIPQYKRQTVTSSNKKSSIFTRAAKFKLPNKRSYGQYDVVIPDVKPRKDFKNIERIANEYIKQRDSKLERKSHIHDINREGIAKSTFTTTTSKTERFTEILKNAEEKIMAYNKNTQHRLNESIHDSFNQYDDRNDQNDHKIMSLLDNLEQEVKHIELDDEERKIFDAKIKKIYGEIVGSPTDSVVTEKINYKRSHPIVTTPSIDTRIDFLESDIKGIKSHLKYDTNNLMEDNRHAKYEVDHQLENNKNIMNLNHGKQINRIKNYDMIETKYNDYRNQIEDDIERKFNDHEAYNYNINKLNHKYNDENKFPDNIDSKYGDIVDYKNIPATRSQNNIGKYDKLKDSKYKVFNLYRGREISPIDRLVEIDKNYYKSVGDDKNSDIGINKWEQYSLKHKDIVKENEDLLGMERKKYYEEKLANIERLLWNKQPHRRKTETDETVNPAMIPRIRPNLEDVDRPRSKMKGDSFYVPDRAKFLHGF